MPSPEAAIAQDKKTPVSAGSLSRFQALVVARTTYRHIARQPLYYILLLTFAAMIYFSRYITQFNFSTTSSVNMIREMGISTMMLWGFLVAALFPVFMIASEMDDRIILTLFSKPIRRSDFLWGRFLGILYPTLLGMIALGLTLVATLWFYTGEPSLWSEKFSTVESKEKLDVWGFVWNHFLLTDGATVLQGVLLGFFQATVMLACSVTLCVFTPMIVSIGLTALFFIMGNLAPYIKVSLAKSGTAPLEWLGNGIYYLLPNLSYFNLQSAFSEGRIVSSGYILLSGCYCLLVTVLILWIGSMFFERKEIS